MSPQPKPYQRSRCWIGSIIQATVQNENLLNDTMFITTADHGEGGGRGGFGVLRQSSQTGIRRREHVNINQYDQ